MTDMRRLAPSGTLLAGGTQPPDSRAWDEAASDEPGGIATRERHGRPRKRVMIFGVFDGLHRGHREFLGQAKRHGAHLIAVVAPDRVVEQLKGRPPDLPLFERIAHLGAEETVNEAVEGDAELGSWKIFERYRPDVIALGYDQIALRAELEDYLRDMPSPPTLVLAGPFEPEVYHSSVLRRGEGRQGS